MTEWVFGLTLLVLGMGGTLLSLCLLSLLIAGLNRAFPGRAEEKSVDRHRK